MQKVITYSAPNGERISLTPPQERVLAQSGVWPRNRSGEFCQIHKGLHPGRPDWTDETIRVVTEIACGHVVAVRHEHAEVAYTALRMCGLDAHGVEVGNATPRIEIRPGVEPEGREQPISGDTRESAIPAPGGNW